jgi:L-malate glycosyltransferase
MHLKILQATEYFLSCIEPDIERFIYELSRGLIGEGQAVTVLAGCRGKIRTLGGIKVEYTPARRVGGLISHQYAHVPPCLIKMHRHGPDVVHAHHLSSGYTAALLKNYDNTPYVLTVHPEFPAPAAHGHAYKKAMENASAVVTVSNYARERVVRDFGIDSTVIPISVDTKKFKPAVDKAALRRRLGLPGSPLLCLASNSGIRGSTASILTGIMPQVVGSMKDVRVLLAGMPGPIEMPGAGDKAFIAGRREGLAAADVFVVPPGEEADSVAVVEAMASGLPVICPDSGGVREYVDDGKNGLLFNPDSVHDLADKIIRLLGDPDMARGIGNSGRELAAARYSWDSAVGRYMGLYRDAVEAR